MALFEIYKKDQGKYVRWGTAAGIGLLVGIGMYWVGATVLTPLGPWHVFGTVIEPLYIKTFWVLLFGIAGALLALLTVNRPRTADFLIMTESEMRKVNWPSWRETWVNTKVVIVLTLLFAGMLWVVDTGFVKLFEAVGILSSK